jgi:hypothetical protein
MIAADTACQHVIQIPGVSGVYITHAEWSSSSALLGQKTTTTNPLAFREG